MKTDYENMTVEELHQECTSRRIWFYYKKVTRAEFRRKLVKMLKEYDKDEAKKKKENPALMEVDDA